MATDRSWPPLSRARRNRAWVAIVTALVLAGMIGGVVGGLVVRHDR